MKILIASFFSSRYPAIGETHALSVIAGSIMPLLSEDDNLLIYDMVLEGREKYDYLKQLICDFRPDILCMSVGYGTYSKIQSVVDAINCMEIKPLRIYGGAIAHYLYKNILLKIDREAIIVRGEGDETITQIINYARQQGNINNISNIAYLEDGNIIQTKREIAQLSNVPEPYRMHLKNQSKVFQIFAELSRGCSWAGCTFCLRGLLDKEGKRNEYRRFPSTRIQKDLRNLSDMGFKSVTFADEDFFGSSIKEMEYAVNEIEVFSRGNSYNKLNFDVSATPHSIHNSHMDINQQEYRESLLLRAKSAGIRKIFLGIESGSSTQLKRYAKGHTKNDALIAIKICEKIGIDVEIGWILFDPLVTLDEVRESLTYLIDNDIARHASYIFNEIRIQKDSRFLGLMKTHQSRTSQALVSDEFEEDTLSYSYTYSDERVSLLISQIKHLEGIFRRVHYPLKNLVRFGVSGAAGSHVEKSRDLLASIRTSMVKNCLEITNIIQMLPKDEINIKFDDSHMNAWKVQVEDFNKKASRIANAILEVEKNPLAEIIAADTH